MKTMTQEQRRTVRTLTQGYLAKLESMLHDMEDPFAVAYAALTAEQLASRKAPTATTTEFPTGVGVSSITRDLLLSEGIAKDYRTALQFSKTLDKCLSEMGWLVLYDGTTFERSYTPAKAQDHRQEG